MIERTPGIVIAGTGSGSGKTSIAAGIAAHLSRCGLKVQTFKVGPDYLDPTWLSAASNRQCLNLDSWMCQSEYIRSLYDEETRDADFSVVEGVMGIFDGADPENIKGSTAEAAILLDLPLYLILNVKGTAGTAAAIAKGIRDYDPRLNLEGIIANYCSSERHRDIIHQALVSNGLPGISAWFSSGELGDLPSRHLGLVSSSQSRDALNIIDLLSQSIRNKVNFNSISSLPDILNQKDLNETQKIRHTHGNSVPDGRYLEEYLNKSILHDDQNKIQMGIAYDEAFSFYYPDNLKMLKALGVRIIFFSPLNDEIIPEGLDAIYFGGGYPEQFSEKLSENCSMRESVFEFHKNGSFIYAECGGLMYLSRSIQNLQEQKDEMTGIFSFSVRMLPRRKALGYMDVETRQYGNLETFSLRGHEYHYSEIIDETSARSQYEPVCRIKKRSENNFREEGFLLNNTYASYVHLHFGSNPRFLKSMIERIELSKSKVQKSRSTIK
ncbi:MAG: cobyrinate a,c-diamide synthase [Spirochaetia bacterium]|nr:cobyrinate a,c-diamide synthase [Spirochaetia bacterium]